VAETDRPGQEAEPRTSWRSTADFKAGGGQDRRSGRLHDLQADRLGDHPQARRDDPSEEDRPRRLDFKDTGVSIKATVKGAPDRASGDASAYEKQLRADKVLGPLFADVNLLTMRRNTGDQPPDDRDILRVQEGGRRKHDRPTRNSSLPAKNVICVICVAVSIVIGGHHLSAQRPAARGREDPGRQVQAGRAHRRRTSRTAHQLKEQHAALVAANQAIANRMIHVGQLAENLQYFYRLESETNHEVDGSCTRLHGSPPPKNAPKTNYTPIGFAVTADRVPTPRPWTCCGGWKTASIIAG
jgi:hypothetical protein